MRLVWATAGLVAAVLLLRARPGWDQASVEVAMQAPPFPTSDPKHWIGPPVSWNELRGRVVVLDVWTFG